MNAYKRRLHRLLSEPLPFVEGGRGELNPRDLPLDKDAYLLFVEFHDTVESEMADGGEFEGIRGFANKAPEHALRLAGVLALVANIKAPDIGKQHMTRGIGLCQYYLNEALRLRSIAQTPTEIRMAATVLDWLTNVWPGK